MTKPSAIKLKTAFESWAKANIILVCTMLFLRIAFSAIVLARLNIDLSKIWTIMSGTKFDIILGGKIAISSLPLILIWYFLPNATRTIANTLTIIYSIIGSLLTEYFCTMSRPLDHVLFAYSPGEIANIVFSSSTISAATIFCITFCIAGSISIVYYSNKININIYVSTITAIIALLLTFNVNYKKMATKETGYQSHADFYLAVNQPSYTYLKIADFLTKEDEDFKYTDISDAEKTYQSLFPQFSFDDEKYPFWHRNNYKDAIGDYFRKTSDKNLPNLVFIIIESFGRKLTGINEPTVSYTPFIDSLAENGLFWVNCLSSTERTFGVLPAVFASAPQGKVGFANMWEPIPDHNSILSDLKNNGYTTSFFYGGCASFDGQDKFLKNNGISYILETTRDTNSTERNKTLKEYHRWGLDDDKMLDLAIKHKKETPQNLFADIYLTLSTHEPFDIPEIEKYNNKIANWGENAKTLEKKNITDSKEVFACFNYMDDCIKHLFEYYKSRPDYENTIFIITGDHRTGVLCNGLSSLSKYHVPLIFYSPLLKEHKKMEGVVSHLDIAPSLNAFLSNNYKYTTNSYCHWLGTTLDTTETFNCNKRQAFMLNNRDVAEFILDTLFLSHNRLFAVKPNLNVIPITDDKKRDSLLNYLNQYQTLSKYAVNFDFLKKSNSEIETIYFSEENFDMMAKECHNMPIADIDGNKCLIMDENTKYGHICEKMKLRKNYKKVKIEIRYKLKSQDTTKTLPKLVIEKDGKTPYYNIVKTNDTLNSGKIENFLLKTTITFDGETKDNNFKIYLWNSQKATMLYDDLYVKIDEAE